jgi:hypothetical protein
MADKQITDLTELGTISADDNFVVDTGAGETRKITFENVEDGVINPNERTSTGENFQIEVWGTV